MRCVQTIMGMPISIDVPAASHQDDFVAAFNRLRAIDQQFSTYKSSSEVSRYRRNEILDADLSPLMQEVKAACARYEKETEGYFSAYYDGTFDPSGYVKGWAVEQVAAILRSQQFTTFCINAAGDVLAASNSEKQWHIGLQHPIDGQQTVGTVDLKNGAIATSGTYERGAHIFNPYSKQAAIEIMSATIYGPDIITTDVFATACIAMGATKALTFIEGKPQYEALFIARDGTVSMTSQFISSKMQTVPE